MKLSNFLTLKAVISTFFGIAFVLVPVSLLAIYGVALHASGEMMAQMSGVSLIGIGLICWFSRNVESNLLSGITLSLLIADGLGFVLMLRSQLTGGMNAMGWTAVALYLLLTLGFGYFYFMKPRVAVEA
jgi:Na+(H+)/acetate symporter ActP